MSTIEKAAARLSARRKSLSTGSEPAGEGAALRPLAKGSRQNAEAVQPLPTRSPERAAPAARFCEIDLESIEARGFITPSIGRSQLAQEMRRIKRPLLLNIQKARAKGGEADTPPANLIMITSALPGEGKTFISINLAMSIAAEMDRRVLLVDADVARGDVARQLDIEPQRGLSSLLEESSYLAEDGVLTTNVERLSILPAGEPSDHVDELFASDLMTVLTRALADADPNRVVIFDAPPLLATTEAAVLAQHIGQTVVVVEANRTPQDAVAQALTHVESCANVSLVLNKTTGKDGSGYSYGYGYGYGGGADARSAEAKEAG